MKRFTLINRGDKDSQGYCTYISQRMVDQGFIVDNVNPELIVVIGGDGTMLHAFQMWRHKLDTIAFVGIHSGTLGFTTDYNVDQIEDFLIDVNKEPKIEEKSVLKAHVKGQGKDELIYALNEIRIENIIRTQAVEVFINNEYLETFQGNGLCISGQHGSTAYNRSIGGAVIYPNLNLLQISEISGIHHRYSRSLGSSLILDDKSVITLKDQHFEDALLCYDHLHFPLSQYQEVEVTTASHKIRFAQFKDVPHVERLNVLF